MILNCSIWPFVLHMFIILLLAMLISRFLHSMLVTVIISLALSIGASYGWRELGEPFMTYWQRLIQQPVLQGGFFHDPSDDANLLGMLFNIVFPAILAYWISVISWRRRKESVD
jgi:hypothetical protein